MIPRVPKISEYQKSCLNCKYFEFNPKRPAKLNRECCYPRSIEVKHGVCLMWEDTRTVEQIENGELIMKGFC